MSNKFWLTMGIMGVSICSITLLNNIHNNSWIFWVGLIGLFCNAFTIANVVLREKPRKKAKNCVRCGRWTTLEGYGQPMCQDCCS